jgi:uncharacterized GH25 family protein
MKIRPTIAAIALGLMMVLICPGAFAHNLWLNPGDYYPQVGTTVDIGIGWGHKYPANRVDQEMKEGRLEEIRAVDPDGLTVNLVEESVSLYKLKVEKAGAYLVTARIKPGFFSMTTDGRKFGNKKEVENCVKCTNFHIEAKTVIIAGGEDKNFSRAAGQTLELIPFTGLHKLKKGDKFTAKVLFEGKPLSGIPIRGTYAGFEAADVGGHAPSKKGPPGKDVRKGAPGQAPPEKGRHPVRHFPVETVTDAQGQAVIQLDKAGYWMIMFSHKPPYTDKETCDEYMYNITYTFEVK